LEQTVNKADLMFLMDALKRGVAEADVARFLSRSEEEVRDQIKALKRQGIQKRAGAGSVADFGARNGGDH
jgi:DNA-binding Lrp family transcriptional regulator